MCHEPGMDAKQTSRVRGPVCNESSRTQTTGLEHEQALSRFESVSYFISRYCI